MKKVNAPKRLMSIILTVLLIMGIGSVSVFADEYSFTYYHSNETMTQVYIAGFSGDLPDDGYVIIPDTIDGYTVAGIAANAFADMQELNGVVIPYTTSYVDSDAFRNSGNVTILFPDEYEEYKNSTESDNWHENIVQDYIISDTTLIGYRGKDSVITIPDVCTAIADNVFQNKKDIKTVYIHSNIESIGDNAFKNCTSLENIILDKGMGTIKIGTDAFKNTFWLDNSVGNFIALGTTLIKYKGTQSDVAIPNVLTAVAGGAFHDTSVTSVKVPVTITAFGSEECFCTSSNSHQNPDVLVYRDSEAVKYCKDNGIKYSYALLPGDVNKSGDITAADARNVLRVAASLDAPFTDELAELADITGDDIITAADAREILRMAADIAEYSAQELITMPQTEHEILLAVSDAVSYANAYNCGYTKFAYEQISKSDINNRTASNLKMFENELTAPDKAATTVYNRNTQAARDNFFNISLVDSDKIKSCKNVIGEGTYTYTITLRDEIAKVGEDTFTQQMFPVEKASHFDSALSKKYWYDKLNWNMTYTDCTIEIQVEMSTGRIIYAILTMNYDFELSGKTGITNITNADGTSSTGTATRTDVIRYTNFTYYK